MHACVVFLAGLDFDGQRQHRQRLPVHNPAREECQ